ncbi:hypothetical protein DAEQUDRAFT_766940 [Daedalea quercina L-15889]|uniref:Cell wall protein n=1 Tax=Daedalea quercina L-15889 TaxID=1314783 RepID=A0A165P5G1_9APHY|nr:hypothetical protein DAEQUDRAFT_766940 [Daedalea quercina L-15889]
MLSPKYIALALVATVWSLPFKREVPQEHSHNIVLASVRPMLALNNSQNIEDPVFALLGDAAAAAGAGSVTNLACLQQDIADQAFTNAKAAGNTTGMVYALIFRALERNTVSVGTASELCNETATNPEVNAISQHQDPASTNANATNKAIVLELAQQIASVGGDPTLALMSGTFAAGMIGDPTAKGNSCDVEDDQIGCIFTQNLLVDDATTDEINAAVSGVSASTATAAAASAADSATATAAAADSATATAAAADSASATAADDAAATCGAAVTVTVTASAAAATSNVAVAVASSTAATAATTSAASGENLQTFTGALGGITAPAVTAGGRGFVVANNDDFVGLSAALDRSCSVQHNACADAANAGGQSFTVGDCDEQDTECTAATSS